MTATLRVFALLSFLLSHESVATSKQSQPNIIFMFGDDLGFNDLGYNSCTDTKTPYLDSLAMNEGLILHHNYVSKICSPSRSAFISGRYPSTLGLQNLVFNVQYPVSLTRQVSILSEEFSAAGYNTHMIGKWHLGYTSWEYTPTYRGFDSFHGFYGGLQYYYSHMECMNVDCFFDLRNGEEADTVNAQAAQYGTFLERDQALEILAQEKDTDDPFFLYLAWQASHTPNEAPSMYRQLYPGASNEDRNYCQAQTTALDGAVGEVVAYLKTNDMWDDTLIVFSSDNGGQYNRHDNFPLRGFKNTSFEGGIRVPAFVTGGYLNDDRKGEIAKDFIVSVVDWYPTLLSAAGIEPGYHRSKRQYGTDEVDTRFDDNGVGTVPLDGHDIWSAIQYGDVSDEISVQSRELLLDLDFTETCAFSSCGAIRSGRWKFMRGAIGGVNESITEGEQWHGGLATCEVDTMGCASVEMTQSSLYCHLTENGCLFNMDLDSCEKNEVGDEYPDVRQRMIELLDSYQDDAAPILIIAGSGMDISEFSPEYLDDGFWGPYREYDAVTFEEELTEFYREMYPDSNTQTDTEREGEDALDENPDSKQDPASDREHFGAEEPQREPEDAGYGMDDHRGQYPEGQYPADSQYPEDRRSAEEPHGEMFAVMESETKRKGWGSSRRWERVNVSKVVLAVLSIGIVVMLYALGRCCVEKRSLEKSSNGEGRPLLSQAKDEKVTVVF